MGLPLAGTHRPGRLHRVLRKSSANSQLPIGPTESSAPTAAVQFYDISSRNQSLDDLCGQEDEDKDDSGLYDLRAVFDGESRADEMAEDARHRADEAEDEEDLAA